MIASAPQLTNVGKSLLMRAIAGEQITFTRFKAGSGSLSAGQTIEELTDLIETVLAFSVNSVDTDDAGEGSIAITGEFTSEDVTEDFVWRELGLYAKGEDNVEILYAYANDGEHAGIVRAISTDVLTTQTVTTIVAVDEAENITVEYTPVELPQTVLEIDCGSISSLPKTVSNARITNDMVVVKAVLGTPTAQTGDWTVTTVSGSLTISGTISGSTTLVLYLSRTIN